MPGATKLAAMHISTIQKLSKLTNQMYSAESVQFSASRASSWAGWERCLVSVPNANPLRILDVGCGNGRFGIFLRENIPIDREIIYVGVDANKHLISLAQTALKDKPALSAEYSHVDIIESLLKKTHFVENNSNFELIALFGVLHHIPSFELRVELLQYITEHLHPKGRVLVSFWLFAEEERFSKKLLTPLEYGIDPTELDPGDYLLPWDTTKQARYCHYSDSAEQHQLIKTAGLEILDTFKADGKSGSLNQYFVLAKT